MTKRSIPIAYDSYDVYETEEFKRTIDETFAYLDQQHGRDYATKWHSRVYDFVVGLQAPATLGNIDPEYYSDTYAHRHVPDTNTTIFYLVEEDQIYLATSGYSGRNWPDVLRKADPDIRRQIEKLRAKHKRRSKLME